MRLLLKCLGWLAMAMVLVSITLWIDTRRAIASASRVEIRDDALAAEILRHFPYEETYLGRALDEVPRTRWQILLDSFPRYLQIRIVRRLGWLGPRGRASLVASHLPMRSREGRLLIGLDRAAKEWLQVPIHEANPQQIEALKQHLRTSRTSRTRGKGPAAPSSPAPPARPAASASR